MAIDVSEKIAQAGMALYRDLVRKQPTPPETTPHREQSLGIQGNGRVPGIGEVDELPLSAFDKQT